MTPRKTSTILAVAFTATACGGAPDAPAPSPATEQSLAQELERTPLPEALANRAHFAPLCDEAGYPLPGNVNTKAAPKLEEVCRALAADAPPPAAPSPKTPGPSAPACDRDARNRELSTGVVLEDALARAEHFRCLCDEQGYPLVGNINAKGTTASAFCAALSQRGPR